MSAIVASHGETAGPESRFRGATVGDLMVTRPKWASPDMRVFEAKRMFEDDHLHILLLVRGRTLTGTVVRSDLEDQWMEPLSPIAGIATLHGRTIGPVAAADDALSRMLVSGTRRLAVVDEVGDLLGLLCLKRRLNGFCSDDDVSSRAAERARRSG